jgi:hypothetical protein
VYCRREKPKVLGDLNMFGMGIEDKAEVLKGNGDSL